MLNSSAGHSGIMERSKLCKKLCYIASGFALILCGIVFIADTVTQWSGLKIFSLTIFPLFFALMYSVAALFRTNFFCRMLMEEEEKVLLERRKENVGNILDISEDIRFSAQRTLQNFEKYLPAVLALVGFILGAVILLLLSREPEALQEGKAAAELMQVNIPVNPVNLAFLSIVCSAFSFFCGVFLTGQSGEKEFRWLKSAGNMFIFAGLILFLSALCALLYIYGKNSFESYISKAVFLIEGLLTVELLANFIMDFYRPRNQEEQFPVYESRLLSLFTEPGGVMRNIASSLDYQFGFKISKTSVYKFVGKVFLPALMIWAFLLWAFTSLGEVGPGELGIRERFGKAIGEELEPGVHWKLPWPFEQIIPVPVDPVQCVTVGLTQEQEAIRKKTQIVLWNGSHYITEDPFLVASKISTASGQDINNVVTILETTLPIYYRAKRTAIRDYVYNFDNIPATLLAIGKAEATAFFANADFESVLSSGREEVCRELKRRIQKQCDAMNMGIEIVNVNMMDAHPPIGSEGDPEKGILPTNVAEAYQQVVIAGEEVKTMISAARINAAEIAAAAEIESHRIRSEAATYKERAIVISEAEKNLYLQQIKAFQASPQMFMLRQYLDFLVNDCAERRKFVVSQSLLSRIYEFNFEDKAKLDLLEDGDTPETPAPAN